MYTETAMSRQLKDWAILGSNLFTASTMTLRVFNIHGALAGVFEIVCSKHATMIADLSWPGGWSNDYAAAEVISVSNPPVWAAPVKDNTPSVLTAQSGLALMANFNLGDLPLAEASDPKP